VHNARTQKPYTDEASKAGKIFEKTKKDFKNIVPHRQHKAIEVYPEPTSTQPKKGRSQVYADDMITIPGYHIHRKRWITPVLEPGQESQEQPIDGGGSFQIADSDDESLASDETEAGSEDGSAGKENEESGPQDEGFDSLYDVSGSNDEGSKVEEEEPDSGSEDSGSAGGDTNSSSEFQSLVGAIEEMDPKIEEIAGLHSHIKFLQDMLTQPEKSLETSEAEINNSEEAIRPDNGDLIAENYALHQAAKAAEERYVALQKLADREEAERHPAKHQLSLCQDEYKNLAVKEAGWKQILWRRHCFHRTTYAHKDAEYATLKADTVNQTQALEKELEKKDAALQSFKSNWAEQLEMAQGVGKALRFVAGKVGEFSNGLIEIRDLTGENKTKATE
jgi:hypothetical protein